MSRLRRSSPARVLVVFGTRPEAIKMAPVVQALAVRTCVTAQHREMLDQVLDLFHIQPDIDLNLMRERQSLSGLGARMLSRVDEVLERERPDWILVQGDTTTLAMAALAAQHRQVRVGHVDAGLRTGDRRNRFLEEMNQVVTDHLSDLCFAPTETARKNLAREGIAEVLIQVMGNTVIDALFMMLAEAPSTPLDGPLSALPAGRRWLLVTAHRREKFGGLLEEICEALRCISAERGNQEQIVYPVHRNPPVREPVHERLAGVPGITLLPPVDYRTLVSLMARCYLVLTNSGCLQEEAPSLDTPVLVLREKTERPDGMWGRPEPGLDRDLMRRGIQFVLDEPGRYLLLPLSRARACFEFWPTPDTTLLHNVGRAASFALIFPFLLYGLFLAIRSLQFLERNALPPWPWWTCSREHGGRSPAGVLSQVAVHSGCRADLLED